MLMPKFSSIFEEKKIAVWGLGKEGLSTLAFLREFEHIGIYVYDDSNEALSCLPDDINVLTESSDMNKCDIILKSPGILIDRFPQICKEKVTSQTEIFMSIFHKQIIGITGTKGKSTTTTLLYHIIKDFFPNTVIVGNIGIPCFDLIKDINSDTIIVFELSCHQLSSIGSSPHIAVLLNIYQDHLDYYKTMERYSTTKKNIYRYQGNNDLLMTSAQLADQIGLSGEQKRRTILVSQNGTGDINIHKDLIRTPKGEIRIQSGDTRLVGKHNLYNISYAYYICHDIYELSNDDFLKSLRKFAGLPHRLQYIGTVNDVQYFDDSISTVPETAIAALESLENVGTIIIGGMDRGIDYSQLASYLAASQVDNIILVPNTLGRIYDLLKAYKAPPLIHLASDLEQAVEIAKKMTAKGKKCLLSPAAASYGFYKNFEERGDVFQKLVMDI